MITIPTHELIGMISDMLPFVDVDKDSIAGHCIRIEQDGDELTMLATNRMQAFRVTWSPQDIAETAFDVRLHSDFNVRITPADAKAIVSAFKMPSKLDYAPLNVSAQVHSLAENTYRLTVSRSSEDDLWSALSMNVTGRGVPIKDTSDVPESDIHGLINGQVGGSDVGLYGLTWNPKVLANLGKVERHGAIKVTHRSSRDGAPVYVKAGRLDGVMFPVRELPGGRVDVLRTGSGVLTAVDA